MRALHARLVWGTDAVTDPPRFLQELLDRMHGGPVCLADELALPHARSAAVKRLVLGVARARDGVAFDAQHTAVKLVFLIGTPRESVTEYLRVAAALTRLLRASAARKALMAAKDEAEFRALLSAGAATVR